MSSIVSTACSKPEASPPPLQSGARAKGLAAALLGVGLLYPAFVYVARSAVPHGVFLALAVVLIALRALTLDGPVARLWRAPLVMAAAGMGLVAALDPWIAVKAYPAVMSFAAAGVFLFSLIVPPSLIERFAHLSEPALPPQGQRYCRRVTMVWSGWLIANGLVAAALALKGSEEAWALWTGLIAYLVMGLLFGGEVLIRRHVRRARVRT